jgi:hypothetical protein
MVEFLVEHGADVNRGDKEGWTPLHATTSCGFVSIAKLVITRNQNILIDFSIKTKNYGLYIYKHLYMPVVPKLFLGSHIPKIKKNLILPPMNK